MRLACSGLFSAIENAVVVTPSPLLAAVAAEQAAARQMAQGRESWQRMPVYSVDAWLAACWQQARYAAEVGVLLSPAQEQALWHGIVEQEHPHLFDTNAAARLARRAARLAAEWRIPIDGELWGEQEDARQFQIWHGRFRSACREQGWITRADLWRLVPRWIEDGACRREETIFAAFETRSPAFEKIRRAIGGAVLDTDGWGQRAQARPAKHFDTFADEIEYAARWARAAFEQKPAHSIAVFVPDLSANRSCVQRLFENVLYPARVLSNRGAENSVFHIAAAPLGEHPIVVNALLSLELARPRIHHADAEAILRSPFIAGAGAERSARARADLELRKRRDLDVTLDDLDLVSGKCPLLARAWAAVRRVKRKMPKQAELPVWSEFFADLLKAVGWPGDAALSAPEQEAVEQWNEALSRLAALGLVTGREPYDGALAHLRRLLTASGPEQGDWLSPIQILDAASAEALRFDRALVTGMSDEMWPPLNELSPLIPLRLLRSHDVPGSTPQSLGAIRERMARNLFECAPGVAATYSGRLSPMAARWTKPGGGEDRAWRGKLARRSFPPAPLDERQDTNAPAYAARDVARGGTGLIRAQSLCPFRAFAEYRLQAKTPEDACFGFDARDRGGFVHRALQLVWQRLRNSQELRAMPEAELRVLVQEAVFEAVADDQSSPLHHLASAAERERLEELILDWLRVERGRKQAFTVETVEQDRYYEMAGLRLKLRVDRIDRLANGRVLLIDYKSGKQSRNKLNCPRPPEPQLLVYASAMEDEVDGVFFGELKPREPRAVGYSREKHFEGMSVTAMKAGWNTFLQNAEAEVAKLASEFVSGYAAVQPLAGACQYCRVRPLCRVNEQHGGEQEQE
ncbi:MAG: PD-(D/E)XK nuclease family protein [Acidobacteriaceae bacterium]|nr:PD-(D/E)XK nuclease family protein [Acidobacteriaceae bacterium]